MYYITIQDMQIMRKKKETTKKLVNIWLIQLKVVPLHPLFGVTAGRGRVAGHVALERQPTF